MERRRIGDGGIEAERSGHYAVEPGTGPGIAARKQGHAVPSANELFREMRNDPLRATVQFRGYRLEERGNLSDLHTRTISFLKQQLCIG